jgi:hypothetical protein
MDTLNIVPRSEEFTRQTTLQGRKREETAAPEDRLRNSCCTPSVFELCRFNPWETTINTSHLKYKLVETENFCNHLTYYLRRLNLVSDSVLVLLETVDIFNQLRSSLETV